MYYRKISIKENKYLYTKGGKIKSVLALKGQTKLVENRSGQVPYLNQFTFSGLTQATNNNNRSLSLSTKVHNLSTFLHGGCGYDVYDKIINNTIGNLYRH